MTDQRLSGSVLVEFILIMPLAILICLAAIDLSRAMRTFKIASTMSREVANIIFRECVTNDVAERNDCLKNAHSRIRTTANEIAADSEILVTLFIWQPDPGQDPLAGTGSIGRIAVKTVWDPETQSNISIPVVNPTKEADGIHFAAAGDLPNVTVNGTPSNLSAHIQTNQAVVVGEAYVPFNPIVPLFYQYFKNGMVHEVTIF